MPGERTHYVCKEGVRLIVRPFGALCLPPECDQAPKRTEIMNRKLRKPCAVGLFCATMLIAGATPAADRVASWQQSSAIQESVSIDYANAIPVELPGIPARPWPQLRLGMDGPTAFAAKNKQPGLMRGARGDGRKNPAHVPVPRTSIANAIASMEFGSVDHPFTTARNDGPGSKNTSYPARASGRLFFKDGSSSFVCSAALIRRGLVVTAAHCVAGFGQNRFYAGWQFIPGYRNGSAPYGVWTASAAQVPAAYLSGMDRCSVPGVVCENDVAVLILTPKNGAYPGTNTGWYGVGYDGYGFTAGRLTQITQIGYPVCLDSGRVQVRNDSFGYVSDVDSGNTVIGSLMCGGASGGPWLVNFGARPVLTGTTAGADSASNVVVGVSSWGFTTSGPKEMGASPFTSENIKALIDRACVAAPSACQ